MIRRRSHLVGTIYDTLGLTFFNKLQRRKIFRSSVKFKKYRFKGTKFKRRQIRKLKHKSHWALQYSLLKYWTDDMRISRQYARFQYHYRFFVNNSFITHHTAWAARSNRLFGFKGQWVSASLTRCLFATTGKMASFHLLNTQKHNHHALAFYPSDEIKKNRMTTPFLSIFDKQLFATNFVTDLNELDTWLDPFYFEVFIVPQCFEFYRILTILWFSSLLKLIFYVY